MCLVQIALVFPPFLVPAFYVFLPLLFTLVLPFTP